MSPPVGVVELYWVLYKLKAFRRIGCCDSHITIESKPQSVTTNHSPESHYTPQFSPSMLLSVDGGQDQKGKETLKSSCGRQQTEEELKTEQSTR